jgi:pimeloyl-ACP methyl ester carboxylesterase
MEPRVAHLSNYSAQYFTAGEGEPLVVVPGLAGGCHLVGRIVRVLSRRWRVICYELRGEGNPIDAHRPHTLQELAADLAEFLDYQLLENPTVVGLSFGSAVALQLAVSEPGRVARLVLQGAGADFGGSLVGSVAREVLEHYPLPQDSKFLNQFFRLLFARREKVGSLFDFVADRCWRTDQSVMAHRLRLLAQFDLGARLGAIRCPTLVVAGQDDAIVSCQSQRALAGSIPQSHFSVIQRAGHLCFLTKPHAFANLVHAFQTGESACPTR